MVVAAEEEEEVAEAAVNQAEDILVVLGARDHEVLTARGREVQELEVQGHPEIVHTRDQDQRGARAPVALVPIDRVPCAHRENNRINVVAYPRHLVHARDR